MLLWAIVWIAVPVLVLALSGALGLLVESATRTRLAWPILVPLGMSLIVVVTTFVTAFPLIASSSPFVLLALAVAGAVLGRRRLVDVHGSLWPLVVAGVVYVVYSVPVALAGATFAGFIKLDDTADWMLLGDRLARFGYTIDGLTSGTGDTFLWLAFSGGYPLGAFADLGVVSRLVGVDSAFVIQPFMSVLAAGMGLAMYAVTHGVVRSGAWRAAVAILASCSALLLGYVLWGGLKEITLTLLLATCAAVLTQGRKDPRPLLSQAAVFAIPMAAVLVVFGVAGAVYLAPLAIAELALVWRAYGWRRLPAAGGVFLGVFVVLGIPTWKQLSLQIELARSSTLADAQDIGNLFGPLRFTQIFGVWLTGDFRVQPASMGLTELLVLVVLVGAVGGVVLAVRARRPSVPVFAVMSLLVGVLSVFGNAWLEGKALAVASPAMLLAAGVAFAWVAESGRRLEGISLTALIGAGLLVSTTMAYREVFLAPADRMQELSQIGQGDYPRPALLLEYSAAAARHFLAPLDAQGAGELRHDLIPMYDGNGLDKGAFADVDAFPVSSLAQFPTLVLRNDLAASRPPSSYANARAGTYYNVWVRSANAPGIITHWPLGTILDPAASAPCATVKAAVSAAGSTGQVAVVRRAPSSRCRSGMTACRRPGPPGRPADPSMPPPTDRSRRRSWCRPTATTSEISAAPSTDAPRCSSTGPGGRRCRAGSNWSPNTNPLPALHLAAGQHTLDCDLRADLAPRWRLHAVDPRSARAVDPGSRCSRRVRRARGRARALRSAARLDRGRRRLTTWAAQPDSSSTVFAIRRARVSAALAPFTAST